MKRIDAQKYINEILAFANGKIIEHKSVGSGTWYEDENPSFACHLEYRIKSQPKLVPFTFEDNLLFRDKWIKCNSGKIPGMLRIISYNDVNIHTEFEAIGYKYLLSEYCFEDNSPCGKLISE